MTGGLPPLTWATAFGTWRFAPVTDVIVLVAAVLYVRRAIRTVPRWPVGRTAAFLGALVVLAVTLQSSIDGYGQDLFWMHMIEHLLLIMAVPVLVILGQPIRLACGTDDRVAALTKAALRSKVVSFLTFPLVGLVCYAAVLIGTHLFGFMPAMMAHPWLHDLEVVLYLVSGYLYFLPLLAHEPIKRELSYPLRVFLLLMGMTADTVVGVMLMMAAHAAPYGNRTWGPSALTDMHTGGGIMWVIGDGLMFAVTVLVVAQWMGDTERQNDTGKWLEAARRSALANMGVDAVDPDGDADVDDDQAALDAYNRMLRKLNDRDQQNSSSNR
ncbi:MAG TPA: cytochrome c oxidase assembly protein [Pseudonocardiaceae bacterium]|nr:cytochrome c oxidase assembly protein [Pseudonocardiaceae bacterium]